MNNDLEQFSEERLKDMQKHVAAGMALGYADVLLIRRVIDIALAAKQAKAVGYIAEVSGNRVGVLRGLPMPEIGSFIYTTPQPAHTEQETTEWTNDQCLEFLQVAFRHNTIDGEIEFDDIRLGVKFALAAAPKPESE